MPFDGPCSKIRPDSYLSLLYIAYRTIDNFYIASTFSSDSALRIPGQLHDFSDSPARCVTQKYFYFSSSQSPIA